MKNLLEILSGFIEKKWYIIIAVYSILFIIFLVNIEKIKVEGNFEKLIPSDSEAIKNINTIRNKFDRGDSFIIVIHLKEDTFEPGYVNDIRDPRVLKYIEEITNRIKRERFVSNVISVENFKNIPPKYLIGKFFDSSFSYTIIRVDTYVGARDVDVRNFVNRIKRIINEIPKPEGVDIEYVGILLTRYHFFLFIESDLNKITILTLIIVLISLLLITRSLTLTLMIYSSILFSVVYMLGFLGILGEKINVITMILVPLIIGLTIDYNIQIAYRIVEEYNKGKGIYKALTETGKAIIFSALTTASAFLSMLITARITGLKSLGLIGLSGILFSLILSLTFLPSLSIPIKNKLSKMNIFKKEYYKEYKLKYTRLIIFLTLIIVSIFFYSMMFKFKVETSTEKAFPQDLPFIKWTERIRDDFGIVDNVILLLEVDGDKYKDIRNKEVLNYISMLKDIIKRLDYVRNVYCVTDFVKNYEEMSENEIKKLLKNNPLIDKTYTSTIILIDVTTGTSLEKISEFVKQLKEVLDRYKFDGIDIRITGSTYLGYELRGYILKDFSKVTSMTTFLVLLLLWLNFRSFKRIFIAILPLALSMIITFGTLGLLEIPLRPEATSLASILIGLGIDYSIITYNRYLEEKKSYAFIISRKPIISSALITIISFSSILFSTLIGIKQLGISLILGIGICAAVIVLILPHLIKIAEKI